MGAGTDYIEIVKFFIFFGLFVFLWIFLRTIAKNRSARLNRLQESHDQILQGLENLKSEIAALRAEMQSKDKTPQ